MQTRKPAAAIVVSLWCSILATSCVSQRPEAEGTAGGAPAIETKDDDNYGGDPDVGGSIGSDPSEPNYSWSPPSPAPSDGDAAGDQDPDSSSDIGSEPPVTGSPQWDNDLPPPPPLPTGACEDRCYEVYLDDIAECKRRFPRDKMARKECYAQAQVKHGECRKNCRPHEPEGG
jgi:hypothetical protein